ncbi:hypothetical protein FACS1894151_07340 [Spirochaetia bacterium]|nr:hypothetical protein FACS1894151_07340 [Spirochaetia bacterium]
MIPDTLRPIHLSCFALFVFVLLFSCTKVVYYTEVEPEPDFFNVLIDNKRIDGSREGEWDKAVSRYIAALVDESPVIESPVIENMRFYLPGNVLSGSQNGNGLIFPRAVIYFYTEWNYAAELRAESEAASGITLDRVWYVPRANPLDGRTDTVLSDCISGIEDIIPFDQLAPPYVALRVDGLTVEDSSYPLVKCLYAVVRPTGIVDEETADEGLIDGNSILPEQLELLEQYMISHSVSQEQPGIFWVAAGGDVMLDRGASGLLLDEGPESIFGETAAFLYNADLALVNLEGAVSTRGTRTPKSFNFRFIPAVVPALHKAGIDAVLTANNHIWDYGKDAFLDTLDYLKEEGVGILGAGLTDDEAASPFLFHHGSGSARSFGIASFPREMNGWDGLFAAAESGKAGMLHAGRGGAEKLKPHFSCTDDYLDIVLFHGGVEWSRSPNTETRSLYTGLIDAGADLIIGSHPHVVQGFEWVNGKPVFWSLGNYVFGGMENTEGGEEGLFINLGFNGTRLVYLEPYALKLTHTKTSVAPVEKLDVFYRRSRQLAVR